MSLYVLSSLQTLKHKQDTDNRDADMNDNEATQFRKGLYLQDKYVSDRFSTLPV